VARILIADDSEDTRTMLSETLRLAGHETILAADGDQALRLYELGGADVVVVDMFMPRKDGLATIRELRLRSPSLKIIAMSAGGTRGGGRDYGVLQDAKVLGADVTLAKPFDPNVFLEAVRTLLGEPPPRQT
jgi:CheY-like chemotaxis protein